MKLTRQSRKPCEAGCEELERTYTAEAFLRFCSAGRNAEIGMMEITSTKVINMPRFYRHHLFF
jgi:hypothetical protein